MNKLLKKTELRLFSEVEKLLSDPILRDVVEYGLTPLYGPMLYKPELALITFQGAGSDKKVYKSAPSKLLYVDDKEKFGITLRKYMQLCGFQKTLEQNTIAHALIFPQAPIDKSPIWANSSDHRIKTWREFSVSWTKILLAVQQPKIILIFGAKARKILTEIDWYKEQQDFPDFAKGVWEYKNDSNQLQHFTVFYCHHLSQGIKTKKVIKCFNEVKKLINISNY